jgi:hypothetical protein
MSSHMYEKIFLRGTYHLHIFFWGGGSEEGEQHWREEGNVQHMITQVWSHPESLEWFTEDHRPRPSLSTFFPTGFRAIVQSTKHYQTIPKSLQKQDILMNEFEKKVSNWNSGQKKPAVSCSNKDYLVSWTHWLPKQNSWGFWALSESSQSGGFCRDFFKPKGGGMVFYQVFLLSPLQCTVTEL